MKKVFFVIAPIFITIFAVGAVFSAYYFPYARKAKQHDNDFLTIKRSYQDFRTNSISTAGQIITGFNSSLEQSKTMVIALRPYENDIDRLKNELDEINKMNEPSISGKNTFIEDLVNKSYENLFKKK